MLVVRAKKDSRTVAVKDLGVLRLDPCKIVRVDDRPKNVPGPCIIVFSVKVVIDKGVY